MDDIEKRRLELDRKRQKLEDMRKARKERTLASTSESLSVETSQKPLNLLNLQLQKKNAHKEDVASLVASLIGSPLAATSSTSTTTLTPQAPTASTLPFTSLHAPYGSESTTPGTSTSASARPLPHLSLADFIIFDVAPKDRVLYSKQVQTTATQSPTTVDLAAPSLDTQAQTRDSSSTTPVVSLAQSPVLQLDRDLTDQDRQVILSSEPFLNFLDDSSKLVERALSGNEKYDCLFDYTQVEQVAEDDTAIRLQARFGFDSWNLAKGRAVSGINWLQKYPELFAVSYTKPLSLPFGADADGILAVWNTHLESRPEFTFSSPSSLLTVTPSPHQPNLILATAYNGQVLLYDTRHKQHPVLKTPLGTGHTHPVHTLQLVGTSAAHSIVTASSDGLMCTWSLDMFSVPSDSLSLVVAGSKTDECAVSSLSFRTGETANFVIGTEEGHIYSGCRFDRAGVKAGLNNEVFGGDAGHAALISSVEFHPGGGAGEFSDLCLSCSVDWSIKVWRPKALTTPPVSRLTHSPILTLSPSTTYIMDARWSPTNPSVFSYVDAQGTIGICDLASDINESRATLQSSPSGSSSYNKLAWSCSGEMVAVGNVDGGVEIFGVEDSSRIDEASRLSKVLGRLESTKY